MKTMTAAEANRRFPALLRQVGQGDSVLVTSRGNPVAAIVPARQALGQAREQAKQRLLDRLASIRPSMAPRDWTRDELYI